MNVSTGESTSGSARGRARVVFLLLLVYLALATAPLVLAWREGLPSRPFIDDFSSGVALIAFAMLLAEFASSGRLRTVSIGLGIDLVMRMHQLLARTLLAIVLLHPFLYSLPYLPGNPLDPTRATWLSLTAEATVSGLVAWVLLVMLVFFAIFRDQLRWRYETWRLGHGFGAALIAAAGTHHTLHAGRYSASPVMTAFWISALALALLALAYIYLFKPLLQTLRPYRVSAVRKLAARIWELRIAAVGHDGLRFRAGQFVWLKLGRALFRITEHPFSIACGPTKGGELRFLIKESGDFTSTIGALREGTRAYLDGPHGNFTLRGRAGESLVLIAGGIGVAPILGLLDELRDDADPRPVTLIYGNRIEEQILPIEALAALEPGHQVRIEHVLSEPPQGWPGPVGVLDRQVLGNLLPAAERPRMLCFVCGPAPMIDAVEKALGELGIALERIVSEKFQYELSEPTERGRKVRNAWLALSALLLAVAAAFGLR